MRKMLVAIVAMAFLPLAGCLDGDDGEDEPNGGTDHRVADVDPFFRGATYDASILDLEELSKPVFDILPAEEVWVTTSDVLGTRIHNAVFRPDTDEPTPVWINFSPYWGDSAMTKGDPFGQYMVNNFVPRGYTVVLSAIRGTGHSEGCFEVSSDRELQDLQEVVDFFAGQDWSNGNVGIGGKSYDSTPQNGMIAKFPTENLKTIFHVSGITDWYRYQFHEGILARADGGVFSAYYSAVEGTLEYTTPEDEDTASLTRLIGDLLCPEFIEHIVEPGTTTVHGMKTPYWIERDWTRFIGDSTWDGSIFFYHGLQDWNVQPDHILPWLEELPDQIQTKVWLHQDEDNGFGGGGHAYPMREDWNLTMLRYMDQELKGVDTGFWDMPANEVEGSDGIWRASDAWPLAGEAMNLTLDGEVLLEATDRPLRYGGAPTITVDVTTLNPDGVLVATLWDEGPDGARQWRNEAVLRLLFGDGTFELPNPVVPGVATTVTATFYPQDDVLEPGHKWAITFQDTPTKSVPLPTQPLLVTPDPATAVVDMVVVDAADGYMPLQPVSGPCHTCP